MKVIQIEEVFQKLSEEMGASKLIGIEKIYLEEDKFSLELIVEPKHLNVNKVTHGGILYTLADQCVGAYVEYVVGRKGTAMDGSMHYYRPTHAGDRLLASITERKQGKRTGIYFVEIVNEEGKLVADSMFTVMYLD